MSLNKDQRKIYYNLIQKYNAERTSLEHRSYLLVELIKSNNDAILKAFFAGFYRDFGGNKDVFSHAISDEYVATRPEIVKLLLLHGADPEFKIKTWVYLIDLIHDYWKVYGMEECEETYNLLKKNLKKLVRY